ncbi:amidophosphoribosyltransferase [Bacteroides propionicifaciens]|uniref:amidophosphoribosyltransferase n=1 Tax=Bacteroides propionicifaciens TaxID=392838 RepID=UPI00036338C6|nr:amidophosphoribosyltransferase [Bacteroides propionicifaciens]
MEELRHECGVAMIRLLKPLKYYQAKYGTWMYAINKLYLLMEKQHNRGQDGAGISCIKLETQPGEEYMFRERAMGANAITDIFSVIHSKFNSCTPEQLNDVDWVEQNLPFAGEVFMGHLRDNSSGRVGLEFVHPFLRRNNWRAKSLALCGNFSMTNLDEIFSRITAIGQHPRKYTDAYILLEQMGHRLDREVERVFNLAESGGRTGMDITNYIEDNVDMFNVLRSTSKDWDGGYVMCGLTGSGEMFMMRDPWGIRPAFYYMDDEILVAASERPVIQTTMNVLAEDVKELKPGQAMLINRAGEVHFQNIIKAKENQACSFERIYLSRGSDMDIYKERKMMGEMLIPSILEAVNHDLDHTVFSFIPNTAEVAFFGLLEGLDIYLNKDKARQIAALGKDATVEKMQEILAHRIRSEKVAIKDIKLRTFIAECNSRKDLATHVYDVTYGSLNANEDNLVIIDDSIVRGTTLRQSILSILDRLQPKKIIVVSSSPQVRYPDYYGIDMTKMEEFIAFVAAVELLKDTNQLGILEEAYKKSKAQLNLPRQQMKNYVKDIYAPFTDQDVSQKIAELVKPEQFNAELQIVYLPIEGLHKACPNHKGDWYFSGNYPTPGGVKLVNDAFINYVEKNYDFKA